MLNENSIFNRVKLKNLNLAAEEFNIISTKINHQGSLFTPEKNIKEAQKKRESILAQLDTNIYIKKEQGGYDANIGVEKINQLGIKKEVRTNVLRKAYLERGSPEQTKKSKHKIEHNSISLTINRHKVERAMNKLKDYKYNKIMNSTPVNNNIR